MIVSSHRAAVAVIVCVALYAFAAPVTAQPDYYDGKRIRFIVGSPVGGGFDTYGRFFARHLSRFIPGHPAVIVQNMPGGAGVTFANFLSAQAPRDGTVLGLAPGTVSTAALFGASG